MSQPIRPLQGQQVLVNKNPRYGTVHALDCKFANRPGASAQYETRLVSDVSPSAPRCRKCGG
jgi:hypothetical protein